MADVRRSVREWAQSVTPGPYLVALSGGGDSLALAWAASIECPKLGVLAGAVIVDHQLQEDSAEVAERAAEAARELGLQPVITKQVRVGARGGLEEAARHARYQAFREAMAETGALGVLLAHTEDDQAETVLMGLARGSGPASLKGMPAQDPPFWRPLLSLPRATLRRALEDAGVSWWEDPHNTDDRFLRARVRHTVMPVVEEHLGPGVTAALARTAELFRQDADYLDLLARDVADASVEEERPGRASVAVEVLERLPDALATRVIRRMAQSVAATTPTSVQMSQVMALVRAWRGQASVALGGASVERTGAKITVTAEKPTKGRRK